MLAPPKLAAIIWPTATSSDSGVGPASGWTTDGVAAGAAVAAGVGVGRTILAVGAARFGPSVDGRALNTSSKAGAARTRKRRTGLTADRA